MNVCHANFPKLQTILKNLFMMKMLFFQEVAGGANFQRQSPVDIGCPSAGCQFEMKDVWA